MTNTTGWWCRCPNSWSAPDENGQSIIRAGEWLQVANRWSPFTDDELRDISRGDLDTDLYSEVRDEIDKRNEPVA